MTCQDVRYDQTIYSGDQKYDWVTGTMYESTTLSKKGDKLVLKDVPFDSSTGLRCNVCEMDPPMNPCTDFATPIDVYDCDYNLCSEYDICSQLSE